MVDVTGLKRPWTRKFGKETYHIDIRASKKSTANKIAKSLRKNGHKARVVKVKTGMPCAIYTEKKW